MISLCSCFSSGSLRCQGRETCSCWWPSGWPLCAEVHCPVALWPWRRAWSGLCCRFSLSLKTWTGSAPMPSWASSKTWALCVWNQWSWRVCSSCYEWIRTMVLPLGGRTRIALASSECCLLWRPGKVRAMPCSTLILHLQWRVSWYLRSSVGQAMALPFMLGFVLTWSSNLVTPSTQTTVILTLPLAHKHSKTWEKDPAGNSSTGT